MADYKKKSVKKSASSPKIENKGKKLDSFSTVPKRENKKKEKSTIKFSAPKQKNTHKPSEKKKSSRKLPAFATNGLRLLKGKKGQIQKKRIIMLSLIFLLILGIVLFCVLTPTGPFEYIENEIRTWGSGSFPKTLSGSELYDAYSIGSVIYTLSDTHAEIYSDSGKHIFSRQHDFNSPVLSVSSQRGLIYDAGGKTAYVYNYGEVVDEIKTKNEIYCAEICRNGTVAIATKSQGYASEVQVIERGGDVEFTWYSANEIVNDVSLSDDGERLAVATVDTSGGKFKSKVYVFKYSSAQPIYEFTYENSIVRAVNTLSSKYFSIVTDNTIDFVTWKNGNRNQHSNAYSLNLYRVCGENNIAVLGNKSNNTITVFGSSGNTVAEVEFLGAVSDIYYYDGIIYVLSDGYLYTLNSNGDNIFNKINLSGYSRIFAIDYNAVVAIGNFGLDKIYLN